MKISKDFKEWAESNFSKEELKDINFIHSHHAAWCGARNRALEILDKYIRISDRPPMKRGDREIIMIISTYGSRFYGSTIQRIDSGIIELNHVLGDHLLNEPDLIFANDTQHFNEAISEWEKWNKKPKLILNVLDLARHVPEHEQILDYLRKTLPIAHSVTTISNTVKDQIKKLLNIDAITIYNPIQDVYYDSNISKTIDFLGVGRLRDPNKNFRLAAKVIKEYSGNFDSLHIVGSEPTGIGNYEGIINLERLNWLYNSSKFMLITSFEEGLHLPLQECFVTGCIPIVCKHMSTALEFCPYQDLLVDGDVNSIVNKIKEINNKYEYWHSIVLRWGEKYVKETFSGKSVAQNILNVFSKINT